MKLCSYGDKKDDTSKHLTEVDSQIELVQDKLLTDGEDGSAVKACIDIHVHQK